MFLRKERGDWSSGWTRGKEREEKPWSPSWSSIYDDRLVDDLSRTDLNVKLTFLPVTRASLAMDAKGRRIFILVG